MRRLKNLWIVFLSLFSVAYGFCGAAVQAAPPPKEGNGDLQLMFVQNAKEVEFNNNKMTLKGIGPSTLYFADRPERITGHMTQAAFLREWDAGKDSFAKDPPNATLSIFNDKSAQDVVVEISNPVLDGQDLSYDVKVLEGKPPAKGGISALFIDWVSVGFGYRPYVYAPRPYYYGPAAYGGCHRNYYTGAVYCYRPGYYY